jgi:hypothetical protein
MSESISDEELVADVKSRLAHVAEVLSIAGKRGIKIEFAIQTDTATGRAQVSQFFAWRQMKANKL